MCTNDSVSTASVLAQLSPWLSAAFIYASARFSLRNKQLDMVLHCHSRFDELQKERLRLQLAVLRAKARATDVEAPLSADVVSQVAMFFDRFWSLQFDEFIAWHGGYLPTAMYQHWLFARWRELQHPSSEWTFGKDNMKSSFEQRVEARWARVPDEKSTLTRELRQFVALISELSSNPNPDIARALRTHGPRHSVSLVRKVFGAY